MRWKFLAVNIAFYLTEGLIIILWLESSRGLSRENDPIYNAGVYLTISVSLIVSISFFLYGARLFYLRNNTTIDSEKKKHELTQIGAFTFLFTACFLLRTIMYSYRPIYNAYINDLAFYILAYFVPEILPCLLEIYVIHKSNTQIRRDAEFIQGLYNDEQFITNNDEQFVANYDNFDSHKQKQENEPVSIRLIGKYGSLTDTEK